MQDPTELNTFVNGVVCWECCDHASNGDNGIMLPVSPLDYNSDWQCDACQTTQTCDKIETWLTGTYL